MKIGLGVAIGLLLIAFGYFGFAYVSSTLSPAPKIEQPQPQPQRIIQLDILNGCGVKGITTRMVRYLRSQGFDVVETKNYNTFQVPRTIVVDRVGNLESARSVAAALGVDSTNVIQQLNPDYYVDVSVIIGADYSKLLYFDE